MATVTAEPPPPVPDDVLVEILTRLPARSLLRFRSVCKTWSNLIQNPNFIALHHEHHHHHHHKSSKRDSILIIRSIPTVDPQQHHCNLYVNSEIVLSFLSNATETTPTPLNVMAAKGVVKLGGQVRLFGPSNGLACLTDYENTLLFNPAIREFKALPPPPFSYPGGLQDLTEAIGFGFDTFSTDYKVIRVFKLFHDEEDEGTMGPGYTFDSVRVQVYNLSTDSWRQLDGVTVPPSLLLVNFRSFEHFLNGAFHFYELGGAGILAFDISEEVFRTIPLLGVCSYLEDLKYRSLSVLNDSLALLLHDPDQVDTEFDIWVMKEYGVKESWTRVFRVGPLAGINWPLAFWKDGGELLLESSSGQLVSCNLSTQEIKEFQIRGIPSSFQVLVYTESLMSVKSESYLCGTA